METITSKIIYLYLLAEYIPGPCSELGSETDSEHQTEEHQPPPLQHLSRKHKQKNLHNVTLYQ